MLSLNHSSLAELYFGAYLLYPSFGEEIRERILNQIDEKDLYFPFYQYLTTYQGNCVDVVISLHRDFSDEKGGLTLLRKLIEQDEIQKSIVIGLDKEEIGKVGRCLLSITNTNKEITSKLVINNIDINRFKNKMLSTDASGNALGLAGISIASKETGLELVETFKATFDAEEDRENIYGSIINLALADAEVASTVVDKIDIDILSLKLNEEVDIEKVWSFVSGIAGVNEEVALKLVDSVSARLNKEEDIGKIGSCVSGIAQSSKEVALKLVKSIDITALSSKINKEYDTGIVGWCISVIAGASKEDGLKLANRININDLSSKINKEDDIGKVVSCITDIAGVSDINVLSSKINKEGYILLNIEWVGKDVALKLVENIDINALSSKINKEEDIERIWNYISTIAEVSEEVANEIINHLNPKQRKELQKRMSIPWQCPMINRII